MVFAFLSASIDTAQHLPLCSHARSLSGNDLGPKGCAALAEGLRGNTTLQSLKCTPPGARTGPKRSLLCQCSLTLLSSLGSLDGNWNQLCGVYNDMHGGTHGTYTTLGITKLCEVLKGSAVTSLECAAAQ